jgi:3-deoxy-D-arabino-heptulosonate 7-phosphate (DAHP) synthase
MRVPVLGSLMAFPAAAIGAHALMAVVHEKPGMRAVMLDSSPSA